MVWLRNGSGTVSPPGGIALEQVAIPPSVKSLGFVREVPPNRNSCPWPFNRLQSSPSTRGSPQYNAGQAAKSGLVVW